MSKIINRIIIIGLIIWGIWYLWSTSPARENIKEQPQSAVNEENPAKNSDNLTFKIKKGAKKTISKSVKKNLTKITHSKTTPSARKSNNSAENVEISVVKPDNDIKPKKDNNNLTKNIAKFVDGQTSQTVTVYFYDYEIDLSTMEIPAGNITFRAINNGRLSHNLTLKDGNGQIMFGRVAPEETKYFKTNLSSSTLEILSLGRADESHDMSETLTVQ